MPRPGIAVSLAMTVRSRLFCRTISSMTRSRRADRHEAADHQACAVRDHGNRLFERDCLHAGLSLRRPCDDRNLVFRLFLAGPERSLPATA